MRIVAQAPTTIKNFWRLLMFPPLQTANECWETRANATAVSAPGVGYACRKRGRCFADGLARARGPAVAGSGTAKWRKIRKEWRRRFCWGPPSALAGPTPAPPLQGGEDYEVLT